MTSYREYTVRIPLAGVAEVYLEVEDADLTEDELFDIAQEKFWNNCLMKLGQDARVPELETFKRLVKGNVFYGPAARYEIIEE